MNLDEESDISSMIIDFSTLHSKIKNMLQIGDIIAIIGISLTVILMVFSCFEFNDKKENNTRKSVELGMR